MTRENTWAASQRGTSCVIFWPWVPPTGRLTRSTASGAFSARTSARRWASGPLRIRWPRRFCGRTSSPSWTTGTASAGSSPGAPSWPSLWSGQIWRSWRHPRCKEKTSVPCGTEVFCQPYSNHTARVTLPERRHLVQTYT